MLKDYLRYDPESGLFTWLKKPAANTSAGAIAGSTAGAGYVSIRFRGKRYLAHRLAWLYVHGHLPANEIDHINGDKKDNRIANLRECTHGQNQQNQKRAQSNNKTGYMGVTYCSRLGKWRAHITVDGTMRYLGRYNSPELAYSAYLGAKESVHPFYAPA